MRTCRRQMLATLTLIFHFGSCSDDATMSWPYTTRLIASADEMISWGNTIENLLINILGRPAEDALEVRSAYKLGLFRHNSTSEKREVEQRRLREYYTSKLRARESHLTTWIGHGFQDDGSCIWLYPENNGVYTAPGIYKGNQTNGMVYESNKYFGKIKRGKVEMFYVNNEGVTISPKFGSYAYDPRPRPWYTDSQDYGTHWSEDFFDWSVEAYLGVSVVLHDSSNSFIGVTNSAFQVGRLEKELATILGTESDESLVFVFESTGGELVLTSHPGNVMKSQDGAHTQIIAKNSNITFIQETASLLQKANVGTDALEFAVPDVNPFLFKGYWVHVKQYTSIGGVSLMSPWLMVFAKQSCGEGYFFNEKNGGGLTAANSMGDCAPCPLHSFCSGGLALPIIKKGFWQDASDVAFLGERPLQCDPTRACTGGQRVSECFSSTAALESCGRSRIFSSSFASRSLRTNESDATNIKSLCRKGHEGVMCEVCSDNFYKESHSGYCLKCSIRNKFASLAIVLLVSFFLASLVILTLASKKSDKSVGGWLKRCLSKNFDMATFKLLWPSLQIVNTIPWNLDTKFPDPFQKVNTWCGPHVSTLEIFFTHPLTHTSVLYLSVCFSCCEH